MIHSTQQLISMMSSYIPLDLLRDDYKKVLTGSAFTDDNSKLRVVPNRKVAEFFNSNERKAMDKEYRNQQLLKLEKSGSNIDHDYNDPKGKI